MGVSGGGQDTNGQPERPARARLGRRILARMPGAELQLPLNADGQGAMVYTRNRSGAAGQDQRYRSFQSVIGFHRQAAPDTP
jgi:hypothetical protein